MVTTKKIITTTLKFLIVISSFLGVTLACVFAGSGTTGHAVMDLNKEDGGERKFILITNNESDICQKVTIPRIQKAITKFDFKEEVETR